MSILINKCESCTLCCDYATIKISPPNTRDRIDKIRWLLLHNIVIFTEYNKDWYAKIQNRCIALDQNGRCSIYATRPIVCSEYSHEECERYKGKEYTEETNIFTTEPEFVEFIKNHSKYKKLI